MHWHNFEHPLVHILKKLDTPSEFSSIFICSRPDILRHSVMDASRYALGSLLNMKRDDPSKFNKLNFYYCKNDTVCRLFPLSDCREIIMNDIVPLKYRHNAQQIRTYLFFGSKQKKILLLAEGLWNENDEEIEVFREVIQDDRVDTVSPVSSPEIADMVMDAPPNLNQDFNKEATKCRGTCLDYL